MMLFQRIFAKELNPSNRWAVIQRLGFYRENFVFSEELPGNTLRILSFENGKVRALLEANASTSTPQVVLRHSVTLPERAPEQETALTDWLLPFPWSSILSKATRPEAQLDFSDPGLRTSCDRLKATFQKLESVLTQNEVACVQMENSGSLDALLFHCVRGKIIRASFLPGFVLSEHQKDLSQTSYSVTTLPTDNPLNLKGFELAFWQLEKTVENQKTFKNLPTWGESSLDIPLEL
ncbi:MAG: hypothetical protein EBQ92_11940 [Proteobacteria bacterium]|nr:hypothetical protein [Pseudomonadota bacterium]